MTPRHISSRSLGFIIVLWALASPPPTVTGAPPESAKQDAKEETVGPFHFPAPAGWKRIVPREQKGVVSLLFVSPDSKGDQQATILVSLSPLAEGNFKKTFENFVAQWVARREIFTALDGAPLDDQGYEALSRTVMVRVGGIGDFTSAEFFALHIGNQMLGVRFANTIQPTQENNF